MLNKMIAASFVIGLLAHSAAAQALSLTSPDVKPGARIADEQVYGGCGGKNISPALSWSAVPKGTKSFALSIYDPDAPTGSGYWHWVVFNIPADVTSLPKGAGDPKTDAGRRARYRVGPISARPAMAARARPRATSRIIIRSRSSPWTPTRSTLTKIPPRPP
jgi:phosphatidylethanolamine-binding protein (PEBP) family uncharacterized protein